MNIEVEEFDPYTLNDDDFLIRPTKRLKAPISTPVAPIAESTKQAEGYRVQIAAVLDGTRAEGLRQSIQSQLETLTYLEYDEDTHFYKIQAGNCRTAREAERLRTRVKGQGYAEAYVIRTQIAVLDVESQLRRPATTQGFRVQIYSASTRHAAEEARDKARLQFDRDDVIIDFEPPYFKVRVGNFTTRSDAEKLLDHMKKAGYTTPFVVQTQIRTSPR